MGPFIGACVRVEKNILLPILLSEVNGQHPSPPLSSPPSHVLVLISHSYLAHLCVSAVITHLRLRVWESLAVGKWPAGTIFMLLVLHSGCSL